MLYGLEEIAAYVDRSQPTVYRWIQNHGFPAGKGPTGEWMTNTDWIYKWVVSPIGKVKTGRKIRPLHGKAKTYMLRDRAKRLIAIADMYDMAMHQRRLQRRGGAEQE